MQSANPKQRPYQPVVIGIGVFLLFGCSMAVLAGTMVLWPRTALDRLWSLNPAAHKALAPFGSSIGPLFYFLSIVLVIAAVGWFEQRIWGWRLTVAIISTQVVGDFVNLMRGDLLRGCIGLLNRWFIAYLSAALQHPARCFNRLAMRGFSKYDGGHFNCSQRCPANRSSVLTCQPISACCT